MQASQSLIVLLLHRLCSSLWFMFFHICYRKRLFNMVNDLPTIFEVVAGTAKKQGKDKSSVSNNSSNRSKSSSKVETLFSTVLLLYSLILVLILVSLSHVTARIWIPCQVLKAGAERWWGGGRGRCGRGGWGWARWNTVWSMWWELCSWWVLDLLWPLWDVVSWKVC